MISEDSDIVKAIGKHVELKRVGHEWQGLCPFHDEQTPSFVVRESGFHCFGCGAAGIDAHVFLHFLSEVEADKKRKNRINRN